MIDVVKRPPVAGLAVAIGKLLGRSVTTINTRRLAGGTSREIWLLEVDAPTTSRFVLRRDPPGSRPLTSRELEFKVMKAAEAAGAPLPRPLAYEPSGGSFGTAGFLMEYVSGETLARRILRDQVHEKARVAMPNQLAHALARLQKADIEFATPPADPVAAALDQWQQILDEVGEPKPVVEVGLRWLREHRPAARPTVLVHGDFRLGNLIVGADGLRAVIDWELWHLGDPAEDIGWLCLRSWRLGAAEHRVAGLAELNRFLDDYRSAGGADLDEKRVAYWQVFGYVKWAVICAQQAHHHLTGDLPSVELAAIGRRSCEAEWDLLRQLREMN